MIEAEFDTSGARLITVTSAAINQIKMVMLEDGSSNLRVFVAGGGCSGFSYGFTVDQDIAEDDIVTELTPGINLLVDPMSIQYLAGATIDWAEDSMGSAFRISNPNAESTCGCGSSFSPY